MTQRPSPCSCGSRPPACLSAVVPACQRDQLAQRLAEQCKILADVTRLKILFCLQDGECCVKTLADRLGTGSSNVCGHLSRLTWLGLVTRRQQGNTVFYRLTCPAFCHGLAQVAGRGAAANRPGNGSAGG